jgi:hypothetical protein
MLTAARRRRTMTKKTTRTTAEQRKKRDQWDRWELKLVAGNVTLGFAKWRGIRGTVTIYFRAERPIRIRQICSKDL